MAKDKPSQPPIAKMQDYFRHNKNFTVVSIRQGQGDFFEFQLNKTQGNIVQKLYESFVNGIQWVSSDELIEKYDKEKTIQKIFKDCGEWKVLIKVSEARKGRYALNIILHPQTFIDGHIVFEEQLSKIYKKRTD